MRFNNIYDTVDIIIYFIDGMEMEQYEGNSFKFNFVMLCFVMLRCNFINFVVVVIKILWCQWA